MPVKIFDIKHVQTKSTRYCEPKTVETYINIYHESFAPNFTPYPRNLINLPSNGLIIVLSENLPKN